MPALVEELEAQAKRRFVRWDAALWKELIEGPATLLAETLETAQVPRERAEALLASYLRLGCEGIGLGYLTPPGAGVQNFLTLAWTNLIPRALAALPAERQAETLAACWNLGENLESSPVWLRRIFLRVCAGPDSLANLESLVADVSRRALDPPAQKLATAVKVEWVHLAAEDRRFLPGSLHFTAPAVVCIHDRHRTGEGGRDAATIGVWLAGEPLLLGAMGCKEPTPKDPGLRMELLEDLSRRDARANDWFAMATNEWRGAVTLDTSQFLVALFPA